MKIFRDLIEEAIGGDFLFFPKKRKRATLHYIEKKEGVKNP
jgi:hypothetical protein